MREPLELLIVGFVLLRFFFFATIGLSGLLALAAVVHWLSQHLAWVP